MKTWTFKQFREAGRAVENLADHEAETNYSIYGDQGQSQPGRIYPAGLVIEGPTQSGAYFLIEGSREIISQDLESLEAMLYAWATNDGAIFPPTCEA